MLGFREITMGSICLRIVLALLIGGVLGIERGTKNRPAGLRTYMLVCLGAALVMMTNQYAFQYFEVSDPVRMGAQVISGIGFLGAGTILITGKSQVKGITTAAGLWAAACSGLAIGVGFYEGALLGGAAIFLVMALMDRLDQFIHNRSRLIDLYIELEATTPLSEFLVYARQQGFDISEVQISKNKMLKDAAISAILTAESHPRRTHAEMTEILSRAPGVTHLEEL